MVSVGAGEAVAGLAEAAAKILTHEIARIDLDHDPKPKKKGGAKLKDAKLKASISISPLTVMFGIAVKRFWETGVWDVGLGILPGMPDFGFFTSRAAELDDRIERLNAEIAEIEERASAAATEEEANMIRYSSGMGTKQATLKATQIGRRMFPW